MDTAAVVSAINAIVSRRVDPADTVVISVGTIHGGTSNIVIPEVVELEGSVRTLKPEIRNFAEKLFREAVWNVAPAHRARAAIDYKRAYPLHSSLSKRQRPAARVVIGEDAISPNEPSWTAGEDFASMLERVPGAYAFFGQKTARQGSVRLHNLKYDFNDELLPLGAGYFVEPVEQWLS